MSVLPSCPKARISSLLELLHSMSNDIVHHADLVLTRHCFTMMLVGMKMIGKSLNGTWYSMAHLCLGQPATVGKACVSILTANQRKIC